MDGIDFSQFEEEDDENYTARNTGKYNLYDFVSAKLEHYDDDIKNIKASNITIEEMKDGTIFFDRGIDDVIYTRSGEIFFIAMQTLKYLYVIEVETNFDDFYGNTDKKIHFFRLEMKRVDHND